MFGNKQRTLGRAHLVVASRGGFPAKSWHINPEPLYSSVPSFAFIIWFLFLNKESKLFKLKEPKLFKAPWYLGTHAAGKLLHLGSSLGQVEWGRLRGQLTFAGSHSFWMNTHKPRAAGRCELCSGQWCGCSCDRRDLGLSFTYSQGTWVCKTVDTNSSPPSPGQVVQPRAYTFQSVGIIRLPSENEFLTMAITTSNRRRFTSQHENCPVPQVGSLPPKPNLLWILWPCNSMWRNLFWGNNTTVYSDISIKAFSLALFVIGKKNKLQCLRFFSVWW